MGLGLNEAIGHMERIERDLFQKAQSVESSPLEDTENPFTALSEEFFEKTSQEDGENKMPDFMKMAQDMMQNEDMRAMQEKIATNMLYGPLLNELALPSETELRVRELFNNYVSELTLFSLNEDYSLKESEEREAKGLIKLREQLSPLLSAEEMERWETYEEVKEQRALEQQYESEMAVWGQGLTQETRDKAKQVISEEMLLLQEELKQSEHPDQALFHLSLQGQALEQAYERLSADLSEEQLRQFERFLDQQNEINELAEQMIRDAEASNASPEAP